MTSLSREFDAVTIPLVLDMPTDEHRVSCRRYRYST